MTRRSATGQVVSRYAAAPIAEKHPHDEQCVHSREPSRCLSAMQPQCSHALGDTYAGHGQSPARQSHGSVGAPSSA